MKKPDKKHRHKEIQWTMHIFSAVICIFFDVCISNAIGSMAAVETHMGESDISIYVKGIEDDFSDASV